MNTLKITIILGAIVMMSGMTVGAEQETNAPVIQARRAEFKNIFDRLKPMHIYGKVIDQNKNAVTGAEVKIGWESADFLMGNPDPGHVSWVTSDAVGAWEFRVEKPHRVFVLDARKLGYGYVFTQESDINLVECKTTKNNPIIVQLRKQGEMTFLMHHEGARPIRVVSPHCQTNSFDILAEKLNKLNAKDYEDIQIALVYDQMSNAWSITCAATNRTDGIVAETNLLYEAPQEGYQKQIVFNDVAWPRYLYLRSRNPAIYSRIELEYFVWKGGDTNQVLSINYQTWVNPYGERNLEYDADLNQEWRLADRLTEEAKAAHLKGKRPVKPDLPKLVKEAKEKIDKSR